MKKLFDSYEKVIEFAIGHEIKASQLYLDLAKIVNEEESRQIFVRLAEEETEHKRRFGSEYNECLK